MKRISYLLPLVLLIALPAQGSNYTFIDALCGPQKIIIELLRKKLLKKPVQGQHDQSEESSSIESLIDQEDDTIKSSDQKESVSCPIDDPSFKEARAAAARALQQARMA